MERENLEWGMVLELEGMLRQEHFLPHNKIEMQCLFESYLAQFQLLIA